MSTRQQARPIEDINRDGTVSIKERIVSVVVLWLILAVGLTILYYCVCSLFNIPGRIATRQYGDIWLSIFLLLSTVVTIVLSIWRLTWIDQQQVAVVKERSRRRQREDEERRELQATTENRASSKAWTEQMQFHYARLYLKRAYQHNVFPAYPQVRDDWIKSGSPKEAWDIINKLMTERGIRAPKKGPMLPPTLEEAWAAWADWELQHHTMVRVGEEMVNG